MNASPALPDSPPAAKRPRTRSPIERASTGDLTEIRCDTTGTSMQVAAVLMLGARTPLHLDEVRRAID